MRKPRSSSTPKLARELPARELARVSGGYSNDDHGGIPINQTDRGDTIAMTDRGDTNAIHIIDGNGGLSNW